VTPAYMVRTSLNIRYLNEILQVDLTAGGNMHERDGGGQVGISLAYKHEDTVQHNAMFALRCQFSR
jgi:hypothetical protein